MASSRPIATEARDDSQRFIGLLFITEVLLEQAHDASHTESFAHEERVR